MLEQADFNRALAAIKEKIDSGESASKAADTVVHQFRHLIGEDDAASECLYEEASEYADQVRERAAEECSLAEAGYGEG